MSACPACCGDEVLSLESIDVARQHRHYTEDLRKQQLLTAAAETATSLYKMQRCVACGLEFAWPMNPPGVAWYALAYQALALYPESRWEFGATLEHFQLTDSVFEFGCGDGAFLELCKGQNIKAHGGDFLENSVNSCSTKGLSAEVVDLDLPIAPALRNRFDQIVAFHVLEHIAEPAKLFHRASEVAKPGAKLWIAVPSHLRPARQRGIEDFLDQPPHHMTRWNKAALERLGRRTGWAMVKFEAEPLPLKVALWWIAISSSCYRRKFPKGVKQNRIIERAFRLAYYPLALAKRITIDRKLSGFSMLACFQLSGNK